MDVLTASRETKSTYNQVTTIRDSKGFVKAVLTGYNQPSKRQKTIIIRKQMYNLKFEN